MYEIYSLYVIEEDSKTAIYAGTQNHTKDLLEELGEEYVREGHDRYIITGILKGNKHELDGYKIRDFWDWEWMVDCV
ncbi:hypothetical protein [Staphylococcus phage vB_SsapH-Golestan-100]|nr:hypothetical protein [Staphylococcus phage vB_SsapH-Golestan-100]